MAQQHNPKIVTDGLICHLDPTNGGKGGSKILAKPTQISDCVLWLDADDKESIVLNGATVSNWLDKSGGGDHVYQSTSSYQPTYVANSINGRGAIDFDGTDNRLYRGHSVVNNLNFGIYDFCLFIAYENAVVGSSAGVIGKAKGWNADSTDYGFQIYHYLVSGFAKPYFQIVDNDGHSLGGGAVTGAEGAVVGAPNISFMQRKGDSSNGDSNQTATRYINGRNTTNNSSGGIDDITTAQDFYIGKANVDADGGYLNGRVFEVIMYSKALTDAERQSVEYYLSRKWAIPLKGKVTTNLADGVNTTISDSGPAEVTHNNTFYFPNPDDDNCDLRLEANEIEVADNLPWTMEFWVKRHARGPMGISTTFDGVWGNTYTSTEYDRLTFSDADEDKLMFVDSVNAGTHAIITNSADIDCLHKWRHVVIAFDGTTDATTAGCVRQYVDGSDKGSTLAFPHADTKIRIRRIASRGSTSDVHRLEGELGNFRVYNKQLSHAEVLQNYNAQRAKYQNTKMSFAAPDNLLVYWDAQSGASSSYWTDGTWHDISSGTAYDATRVNGPSFSDSSYSTETGSSPKHYSFDGVDEHFEFSDDVGGTTVDAPSHPSYTSVGVWFKTALSGAQYGPVSWANVNNDGGINISVNGANQAYASFRDDAWSTGSYPTVTGTSNVTGNVWHYVVFTYDSVGATLYVDGVAEVTSARGSAMTNITNEVLKVGLLANHPGTYYFTGDVALMQIHNIGLSADQVMQNYNYFKHRFGK